jgi:hypothetical protein
MYKNFLKKLYEENKSKVSYKNLDHKLNLEKYLQFIEYIDQIIQFTTTDYTTILPKRLKLDDDIDNLMSIWTKVLKTMKDINYISIKDFLTRLFKVSTDILKKIENSHSDKTIIIINGPISKSSFWVWFFIYPRFSNIEVMSKPLEKHERNLKYTYIYLDDCIYSGLQIGLYTKVHFSSLINEGNVKLFLLVPFISDIAFRNIRERLNFDMEDICEISKETIFLPTNYIGPEMFQQKILMENIKNNLISLFIKDGRKSIKKFLYRILIISKFLENYDKLGEQLKTRTYFQHKMASNLSTIQHILNHGVIYSFKEDIDFSLEELLDPDYIYNLTKYKIGSLISNCETYDEKHSTDTDIEEIYRCPPSFYKSIIWTYNGQNLDRRKNISTIMEENI